MLDELVEHAASASTLRWPRPLTSPAAPRRWRRRSAWRRRWARCGRPGRGPAGSAAPAACRAMPARTAPSARPRVARSTPACAPPALRRGRARRRTSAGTGAAAATPRPARAASRPGRAPPRAPTARAPSECAATPCARVRGARSTANRARTIAAACSSPSLRPCAGKSNSTGSNRAAARRSPSGRALLRIAGPAVNEQERGRPAGGVRDAARWSPPPSNGGGSAPRARAPPSHAPAACRQRGEEQLQRERLAKPATSDAQPHDAPTQARRGRGVEGRRRIGRVAALTTAAPGRVGGQQLEIDVAVGQRRPEPPQRDAARPGAQKRTKTKSRKIIGHSGTRDAHHSARRGNQKFGAQGREGLPGLEAFVEEPLGARAGACSRRCHAVQARSAARGSSRKRRRASGRRRARPSRTRVARLRFRRRRWPASIAWITVRLSAARQRITPSSRRRAPGPRGRRTRRRRRSRCSPGGSRRRGRAAARAA